MLACTIWAPCSRRPNGWVSLCASCTAEKRLWKRWQASRGCPAFCGGTQSLSAGTTARSSQHTGAGSQTLLVSFLPRQPGSRLVDWLTKIQTDHEKSSAYTASPCRRPSQACSAACVCVYCVLGQTHRPFQSAAAGQQSAAAADIFVRLGGCWARVGSLLPGRSNTSTRAPGSGNSAEPDGAGNLWRLVKRGAAVFFCKLCGAGIEKQRHGVAGGRA